jgi:CheY-like chemotaxis protein
LPAGASYCGAGAVGPGRFLEAAMLNYTLVSIVDDNQPFRESPRKLVMLFGYTVEAFPSAADFLASRLLPETDCLVTDVHMPGMTGFELYRHLVDAGYAIPTILVTAYPDEIVRDRALDEGVVCYPASQWTMTISSGVCVRLCSLIRRLKTIHESSLAAGSVN